jgi:hypothetical protein
MKRILILLVLIVFSKLLFGHNESLPVGGYFYDGKSLIEKDSVLISKLIDVFHIDIKEYELTSMDKAASLGLLDTCDYTSYSLTLDKRTKVSTYKTKEIHRKNPKNNKYFTIFSFDSFYDEKVIGIFVF